MGSGNWIVDNLNSALATWNEKLTEIWTLISTSPEEFKGGGIWDVILNIHDALRAIGYALLVLFFVAGVVKTCGSFTELKRPEVAVKTFVRFALAQGAVTYGLELMMTLFSIAQGAVSTIMDASGLTAMSDTALPDEMVTIIEDVGFKTFGCGAAIATSSMATEMIIGKSVQEALEVTNKAVMEALGGLPPVKVHCSLLAEQAVHAALWDYAQKNHITIEGLKPPVNDVDELEEAHKDEA